ncbi:MAG: Ig-like domain-containing protein [Candidatus Acidiferrales bacterium]
MAGSQHWTLKGSTVVALLCAIVLMSSCSFSPSSNHPTLVSIAVTAPSLSMAKGASEQFTATAAYSDKTTQNLTSAVTWVSQNTGVATVTASGWATAAGAGTSTIQAISGTVVGSATLTVSSATLVSIAVTASSLSIAKGTTAQFTATGTFSDNSTQNLTNSVTWSSQSMNVAMITADGLAMGLAPGTTKIQATSGSVSGSVALTVTAATLVSIAVTAPSFSIAKGTSEQFTATGTYSDGSTQNITGSVTWSSQTASVATIASGGMVTAAGVGTSKIQAVSGAISGSATLTVTAATLVSIAVTAPSLSTAKGTTAQFTATGTFSDNSTQNLTNSVTWSSQTTSVATIAADGLATAVGIGTSSIKATLGAVNGSATLTVTAATLVSIAVTPANPTIGTTATEQFTATGTYTDNSTQNLTTTVTWSSSQTNIATISNTAGTNGLASAAANGTTTIQAMLGSVQGSTVLTISAISLQVIVVSPQNPSIADSGATQDFTATGHYSDGSTQDLTSSATWTSSNSGAASVNAVGVATSATLASGVNAAFTSIQATVGSTKGVSILSVTNHMSNTSGFAGVFTQHNDIGRTGQNLSESILTQSNVNTASFGKLFSQAVDGFIYAQPLYVPNVSIAGSTHNVIYVATEGDSVYAFDADSNTGTNGGLLWHASLIDTAHGAASGATTVNIQQDLNSGCTDLVPQVGITSTPVIDPSSGTMYVEAKSKENGNYIHRLHALDITTGAEKSPGPVQITATVSGNGDGGSTVSLDGLHHLNRVGLLLLNGTIYIGYASHCDITPYHGWLLAYDAGTFTQTSLLVTTPNGGLGGFWMSGAGVAADSNTNIFIASGNGDFDTVNVPAQELGDTIMKVFYTNSSRMSLLDYFTPYNQSTLDDGDTDVGSGGVLLLPDQPGGVTHELVEAGKEGTIYVINRDQMTAGNLHYCQTGCNNGDPQITQEIQNQINGLWSTPAYFNGTVYFCGAGDNLRAFPLSSGLLSTSPSETSGHSFGFPGCTPVASANGNTNGIIWAVDTSTYGVAAPSLGPAVLYAYQAGTLNMLWNSSQTGNDTAGDAVKFAVPTIANGKVYLGTQTELDVYGPK